MENLHFDCVIIGGGLAGLSTAYFQSKLGKKVVVLDRQQLGMGSASWAATGVFMHRGASTFFSQFREFQIRAVEYYQEWLAELNQTLLKPIFQKQTGEYHFFDLTTKQGLKYCELELKKLQRESSCDFEVLSKIPKEFNASLKSQNIKTLWFPKETYIQPQDLLQSLKYICIKQDVQFFNYSLIESIQPQKVSLTVQNLLNHQKQNFSCDKLVIAAGALSSEILEKLNYPSQVIAVKGMSLLLRRFYSLESFVHYNRGLCFVPRGDYVIVGSTSEKDNWDQNESAKHLFDLKNKIQEGFKIDADPLKIWTGLRPKMKDRLPLIGFVDDSQKVAVLTGHYKCGIGMIPYSAYCLSQILEEEEPSFNLSPFDPQRTIRKPRSKKKSFV